MFPGALRDSNRRAAAAVGTIGTGERAGGGSTMTEAICTENYRIGYEAFLARRTLEFKGR
jgi:hypothetical protein